MGITPTARYREFSALAERRIVKRYAKPPRSLRKKFRRKPSVKKATEWPFIRQFGWYHGAVFVPYF